MQISGFTTDYVYCRAALLRRICLITFSDQIESTPWDRTGQEQLLKVVKMSGREDHRVNRDITKVVEPREILDGLKKYDTVQQSPRLHSCVFVQYVQKHSATCEKR